MKQILSKLLVALGLRPEKMPLPKSPNELQREYDLQHGLQPPKKRPETKGGETMNTEQDRRIAEEAAREDIYWLGKPVSKCMEDAVRIKADTILTAIAEAKKPLEDDAARYRYLRLVWEEWTGVSWTGDSNDVASKLDAAIDAAMEKNK